MDSKIFQEIAESYLYNQIGVLRNLSAKVDFKFIVEFAAKTEVFLTEKFDNIKTKKDLLSFQNFIDTLDEINGIFLRTTDESSYWILPLIKQFYEYLDINLTDREILIVNDYKVSYSDGGYGVIVDLFNNQNISNLQFPVTKKIDVFFLPRQSNFSISSIAILAHEVGHVYFSTKKNIQEDISNEILKQLNTDGKSRDLFNDPLIKFRRSNISSHIEELFCDNLGNYLLGPIFNFSSIKLLGLIEDDELTYSQGSHPPVYKRLYNAKIQFMQFFEKLQNPKAIYIASEKIKSRYFDDTFLIPALADDLDEDETYFIELSDSIAKRFLLKFFGKESLFEVQDYETALNKGTKNLNQLIPLVETIDIEKNDIISPWELIVATAFYFSGNLYEKENDLYKNFPEEQSRNQLKQILINFLKYSINIYSFYSKVRVPLPERKTRKISIWNLREKQDPFIVVPTIDFDKQYSTNAVDLRLGNSFITSKLTEFTHIPTQPETSNPLSNKNIEYFFEKHFIPFNKTFTLHPHNFVLAVTLEYISIPRNFYALVLGRSTWGRLGLNIATATAVGPGFKGCITLELRNLSEVPITLNVGTRICQICLIKNPIDDGTAQYYLSSKKYICPTEVEYPKINLDPDWELLQKYSTE